MGLLKLTEAVLHRAVGQQAIRNHCPQLCALALAGDVKRAAVRSADAPDEAGQLQGRCESVDPLPPIHVSELASCTPEFEFRSGVSVLLLLFRPPGERTRGM